MASNILVRKNIYTQALTSSKKMPVRLAQLSYVLSIIILKDPFQFMEMRLLINSPAPLMTLKGILAQGQVN